MAELEPLDLLERIVRVADVVLRNKRHDDVDPGRLSVSDDVLLELWTQAELERLKPREDRVVDDLATMLVRALQQIQWQRAAGDIDREQRWTLIASTFLPVLRTDWARASAASQAQ